MINVVFILLSSVMLFSSSQNLSLISALCSSFAKSLATYKGFKELHDLEDTDRKPLNWDNAKPLEAIPGPKSLPVIGNTWRFMPIIGKYHRHDFYEIMDMLHKEFGNIVLLKDVSSGRYGKDAVVFLFDAKDIEHMHRNEGIWPVRNSLLSFKAYRYSRVDVLPNVGLTSLQGEEWYKSRSVISQILMKPKLVLVYIDQLNNVADQFINNMLYFSKQNKHGEMPKNFLNELYKWSLESIAVVTMNKNLGCLNLHIDNVETKKLIKCVTEMFDLMYYLEFLPSNGILGFSTRRKFYRTLDYLIDTNLKIINESLENTKDIKPNENAELDVLQKLLKVDKDIALSMSVDMMIAGIDTTGRVLGAALYYLSKNQDKQEKVRNEALSLLKNKDSPITEEILEKAEYIRAAIKETLRLSAIGIGNLRAMRNNLILGGYQIPKGTEVQTTTLYLCHQEKYFTRPMEFLPERWLSTTKGPLSHKNTNPFVYAPFGFGPRTCVGKRIANLELEIALLKIFRNFQLDWPHKDMTFKTYVLHGIADPLKLHVKPLNQ